MNGFLLKVANGWLELQADSMPERVALFFIAAVVIVALAGIGAWAWIYMRRSR